MGGLISSLKDVKWKFGKPEEADNDVSDLFNVNTSTTILVDDDDDDDGDDDDGDDDDDDDDDADDDPSAPKTV